MKKLFSILILFLIISTFYGCINNRAIMSYNSEKYVKLFDYTAESIKYSETQITNEDVKAIITTEMSVNEAYIEIKSKKIPEVDDIVLISINGKNEFYTISGEKDLYDFERNLLNIKVGDSFQSNTIGSVTLIGIYRNTEIEDIDFVLNYYGYSAFDELEKFIRKRASEEIIFNYIFDKINEKSTVISYPDEIQQQINNDIQAAKNELSEQNITFNDYLNEQAINEEDFNNSFTSSYYDLMLYKAILDNEKIIISQAEIDEYKNNGSIENTNNNYYIYTQIAYQKVRDLLISKVEIIE